MIWRLGAVLRKTRGRRGNGEEVHRHEHAEREGQDQEEDEGLEQGSREWRRKGLEGRPSREMWRKLLLQIVPRVRAGAVRHKLDADP